MQQPQAVLKFRVAGILDPSMILASFTKEYSSISFCKCNLLGTQFSNDITKKETIEDKGDISLLYIMYSIMQDAN